MERENFYLLLKLPLEPVEQNPQIIDAAIKKVQAEWSRYRNHPTKALQAKKYIGLIPEIRKVMADPEARRNEAAMAQKILQKQQQDKYAELDRHLNICFSKGFVSQEEIIKLANLHNVSEGAIRQRINVIKTEKFSEIDKHLEIRVAKGYVTEEEIAKLARMHSIDKDQIRQRVNAPIRSTKAAKQAIPLKIKRLDKAIEKIITDNLKIIGKGSLYEFLGVAPSVDIAVLQQKAKEKEGQILKIGKKDAMVTASGILAGQCISIFKTPEGRAAYDASRARDQLKELNSDIDVAGMEGKIRAEYFDFLVKTGVGYGMDPEEAAEYIRKYCQKKKWSIEEPSVKSNASRTKRLLIGAALGVLLLASSGAVWWWMKAQRLEDQFQQMMAKVASETELTAQLNLLQAYLQSQPQNKFTPQAEAKVAQVQQTIMDQDFQNAMRVAGDLRQQRQWKEAIAVYQGHLTRFPQSPHAAAIKQHTAEITAGIDQQDYQQLEAMGHLDLWQRLEAYQNYLQEHPKGQHRQMVQDLLAKISEEYYLELKKLLAVCEQRGQWQRAIDLSESYLQTYPQQSHSKELKRLQGRYRQRQLDHKIIQTLDQKASAHGTNYQAAKQVYADYLQAYPNSSIKAALEERLSTMQQKAISSRVQSQRQRLRGLLAKVSSRFNEKKEGTVTDSKTGLVWNMLDSGLERGECMDYETARQYVKTLDVGGYKDWRLPTAKELAGIYKTKPVFPSQERKWFWSSESYSRYADGWGNIVDVVSNAYESKGRKQQMESWECGHVHAVRP